MKIVTVLKFNGQGLKQSIIDAAGGTQAVINYVNNNEELIVSQTVTAMVTGIKKEAKNKVECFYNNKGFELNLMVFGALGETNDSSKMQDMMKMLNSILIAVEGSDEYEYCILEKEEYKAI